MSLQVSRIWIITGPLQTGKTHFCTHLLNQAQAQGFTLAGVICPPIFTDQQKTGISIEDISTHHRRTLATIKTNETKGILTNHWVFNEEAMAWGNQILANTEGCDLLLVDELGPLEFNRQQGWQNGLRAIDQGKYKIAVVVIRPTLIDLAITRWPHAQVIQISPEMEYEETKKLVEKILCDI